MKEISYAAFLGRIHARARLRRTPLRVMFEATYRCNFRCRHCYVSEARKKEYAGRELGTAAARKIMDALKRAGCLYLGFTGGEVFLRDDIFDLLGYARTAGFKTIINTNGSLIDAQRARLLGRLNPNKVDITVHAMDEAVFDAITGTPGFAAKVFRAIRLLRENNVRLGLKTCLLPENADQIARIEEFARAMGARHRLDDFPYPPPGWQGRPYATPLPHPGVQSEKSGFWCGAGLTQCALTPAGEITLCLMVDYPKLAVSGPDFPEKWAAVNETALRLRPQDCDCPDCRLQPYCGACPACGWLENGKPGSCSAIWKRKAQALAAAQGAAA